MAASNINYAGQASAHPRLGGGDVHQALASSEAGPVQVGQERGLGSKLKGYTLWFLVFLVMKKTLVVWVILGVILPNFVGII